MRKIRREKTIKFEWSLTINGEVLPLEGENIKIELTLPSKQKRELPFIPVGNVAKFTYMGTMLGDYILTAWLIREGEQTALDVKGFELVERTYDENDETTDNLQFETLELNGNFETSPTEERVREIIKEYTGNLIELHTQNKSSIVAAINEVYDMLVLNLDGEETVFDESLNGKWFREVNVNYSMATPDRYYTLCLPFDLTDEELTEIFGEGYILGVYESFTMSINPDDTDNLRLGQIKVKTQLEAGVPYVIKPTQSVPSIKVKNKIIKSEIHNTVLESGNYQVTFYGDFIKRTVIKYDKSTHKYNYAISGGQWMRPNANIPLNGYRLYFTAEEK